MVGRKLSPKVRRVFEMLQAEGCQTDEEIADALGTTPTDVRHALWYSLQRGLVELTYGLTREGASRLTDNPLR